MKQKNLSVVCAMTLAALTVVSCGGSSDEGPLLTGVFVDSPVTGMKYVTPTVSGFTNPDGEFSYRAGESVVFSIGNLSLPVVVASDTVTPLDMTDTTDITDTAVINVARLLQSLDADGDPSNGIYISNATTSVFEDAEVFDIEDDTAVDNAVDKAFNGERQSVSAVVAMSHFVETLSENANSVASLGQLQHLVPVNQAYSGDTLLVDGSNFALTRSGVTDTGSTVVNSGVYQLIGVEEELFISVTGEEESKLACIARAPMSVEDCEEGVYHVFEEEQQALNFNSELASGLEIGAATDAADLIENSAETVSEASTETAIETAESLFPVCTPGAKDADGDGFAWQDDQSCVIPAVSVVEESTTEIVEPAPVAESELPPVTQALPAAEVSEPDVVEPVIEVADSEQVTVELPPVDAPVNENNAAESPDEEPVVATVEEVPVVVDALAPVTVDEPEPVVEGIRASDITDLIVLTGQTNAAALETGFDAVLDASDERVFAFVENEGWQVADLRQAWDANLPGNFADSDRDPYNNLAFQLGKALAEEPDRVVGIILLAAPGEGISHWDFNSEFYKKMRARVTTALADLPQKETIDAMIWAQGETDWLFEGTADAGATGFGSTESEFYRDYYPTKLSQLISNLRSEFWFASQAQFICTETKKAALNPHLMALNTDGDNLTGCAQASDLETRPGDVFGNQFSAASLRMLGGRLADIYLGR